MLVVVCVMRFFDACMVRVCRAFVVCCVFAVCLVRVCWLCLIVVYVLFVGWLCVDWLLTAC